MHTILLLLITLSLSNEKKSQQLINETISDKHEGRKREVFLMKENPG